STEAKAFFEQGVGQLHGFWYYEAERSFRQVALLDPNCAMAYWGCAMANVNNAKRASGFIKKAAGKKMQASKREQDWITALENFYADEKKEKKTRQMDFIKATEDIVSDFPDDLEAKAFLAWAIWHAKEDGVPMVSRETVDALIQQIFAKEPMHPAHHYVIHLWDGNRPARAIASAAQCGQTSPAIAHMWHMPGHTFSKANRLDDAEWQQEAATRVDHAYMIRTQILPDQIHNYAHNTEWLIRTLNQIGQAHKAVTLAKTLIEIPRHPEFNTIDKGSKSAGFGRTRLLETLAKFELWDELLALDGSPYLDVTQNPAFEASRLRALGVASFFKNDSTALGRHLAELTKLNKKPVTIPEKIEPVENAEPAEKSVTPENDKLTTPEKSKPGTPEKKKSATPEKEKPDAKKSSSAAENALAELRALRAILDSKFEEASKELDKARDTPKDRLVRYQLRMNEKEKAAKLALQLPQDAPGVALRVDVLLQCDKIDDAKKQFDVLRTLGATMDGDLPISKRMDEVASQFGITDAWRNSAAPRSDSGVRPPIETLGPLQWHPWDAAGFSLPDRSGRQTDFNDFKKRPLIVLFYLGHTCGHCMEQLKAFAASAADFEKAGIGIVAIGSEQAEELSATSSACSGENGTPFPLLADPSYNVFRQWRCYDDFEGMGLHGVFLVDTQGQVRWADVGYEPFKNTRFLIEES
ncbi:MAG: redoxin domain-containing protein, partial [Verrucomicrobia bacterium]|nr:redoxin domain-containing protein [Verrucomicrobiota bacterium]